MPPLERTEDVSAYSESVGEVVLGVVFLKDTTRVDTPQNRRRLKRRHQVSKPLKLHPNSELSVQTPENTTQFRTQCPNP